jgi:hypothetical protein
MENEIKSELKPLRAETPRPRNSIGGRGPSLKTIERRKEFQGNPGKWLVWKDDAKTGGDTGQVLRTLTGITEITGIDRKTLPYEATARKNQNGLWTIYARYVGENREFASVV